MKKNRGVPFGPLRLKQDWIHPRDLCVWCQFRRKKMSDEHITPRSAGGANDWTNVTLACRTCNTARGSTPFLLWLWAMHAVDRNPQRASQLLAAMSRIEQGKPPKQKWKQVLAMIGSGNPSPPKDSL